MSDELVPEVGDFVAVTIAPLSQFWGGGFVAGELLEYTDNVVRVREKSGRDVSIHPTRANIVMVKAQEPINGPS